MRENDKERIQTRIDMIRAESRVLTYKIERMLEQRKDLSNEKRKLKELITTEDTEDVSSSSGEMSRFGTGAVRDAMQNKGLPSQMPMSALRAVSRRFEDGAEKCGRDNWKKAFLYLDTLIVSIGTCGILWTEIKPRTICPR